MADGLKRVQMNACCCSKWFLFSKQHYQSLLCPLFKLVSATILVHFWTDLNWNNACIFCTIIPLINSWENILSIHSFPRQQKHKANNEALNTSSLLNYHKVADLHEKQEGRRCHEKAIMSGHFARAVFLLLWLLF